MTKNRKYPYAKIRAAMDLKWSVSGICCEIMVSISTPLKKNRNITGDKIILQVYLEDCQMIIN